MQNDQNFQSDSSKKADNPWGDRILERSDFQAFLRKGSTFPQTEVNIEKLSLKHVHMTEKFKMERKER
jgi:hypothetical protein